MKPFWRRNVFGVHGTFSNFGDISEIGWHFGNLGDKFGPKGTYLIVHTPKCPSGRVQPLFNKLIIRGFQLHSDFVRKSWWNLPKLANLPLNNDIWACKTHIQHGMYL